MLATIELCDTPQKTATRLYISASGKRENDHYSWAAVTSALFPRRGLVVLDLVPHMSLLNVTHPLCAAHGIWQDPVPAECG